MADNENETKTNDEIKRKELAAQLDKELENYISSLEKRSTNEAWPEDRWQEEMEKHPFFMTKLPENGEVPPLLQGLQDLKYSVDENSPEELAKAYKEDGNYHFKLKKYRMAILCYTEGIKHNCPNVELNAQLFNNRAAAHYYLGNFRSCYNDCRCALKLSRNYPKAIIRLAHTCFKLELYNECLNHCHAIKINKIQEQNMEDILDLVKKATRKKKEKECEQRKNQKLKQKDNENKTEILEAIKLRGISLNDDVDDEYNNLNNEITQSCVHFDNDNEENKRLIWPVLLLYPEYETTDIIENFHEDQTFKEQLVEIFNNRPEWDLENKYHLSNINLYYEDIGSKLKAVNINSPLGSVLSKKDYRIQHGIPLFIVLIKDSIVEQKMLQS